MKQQPTDNYSVAWFKLAEFVARGEKERALGLYRLLAHSIEDTALVKQLEGDLLRSFDDETALQKYEQAAQNYKITERLIDAVSVYEHLILLNPEHAYYYSEAIALYRQLDMHDRAELHEMRMQELG